MVILMLSGKTFSLLSEIYMGDLTTHSFDRTLALEQLSRLPHAPSVGLHDVPSESVGTHIGLKDYDELDERLARECSDSRYISVVPWLVKTPLIFFDRTFSLRIQVAGGCRKYHLRVFGRGGFIFCIRSLSRI